MDPRLREDDVVKLSWSSNPTISAQSIVRPAFCNTHLREDGVGYNSRSKRSGTAQWQNFISGIRL
jgi:hypothetical protein